MSIRGLGDEGQKIGAREIRGGGEHQLAMAAGRNVGAALLAAEATCIDGTTTLTTVLIGVKLAETALSDWLSHGDWGRGVIRRTRNLLRDTGKMG